MDVYMVYSIYMGSLGSLRSLRSLTSLSSSMSLRLLWSMWSMSISSQVRKDEKGRKECRAKEQKLEQQKPSLYNPIPTSAAAVEEFRSNPV